MAEPLAAPGKVIKRLRGTAEEQIAALPPNRPPIPAKAARRPAAASAKPPPKPKPKPRPSRDALDAAEATLEEAERTYAAQAKALADREAALAKERRKLEQARDSAIETLRRAKEREEASYQSAMTAWRE